MCVCVVCWLAECKLAKMLGNEFFKPAEEMQRLKQNRDIASVHLSSRAYANMTTQTVFHCACVNQSTPLDGFQYKALHDCINLAAAENEVQGIFFVAFDHSLCKVMSMHFRLIFDLHI